MALCKNLGTRRVPETQILFTMFQTFHRSTVHPSTVHRQDFHGKVSSSKPYLHPHHNIQRLKYATEHLQKLDGWILRADPLSCHLLGPSHMTPSDLSTIDSELQAVKRHDWLMMR